MTGKPGETCPACGVSIEGQNVELVICCGKPCCSSCWEEAKNCPNERCSRIGAYWRFEPGAQPLSAEDYFLGFEGGLCCGTGVGQA